MTILETYQVPYLQKSLRLSDLKAGTFQLIPSRKAFKKLINKGLVYVNDIKATTATPLYGRESICIYRDTTQSKKPSITIPLEVLLEDDYLAVIHKPAGIEVSGNKKYTIENALQNTLKKSTQKDALQRPEPIHRLDYPTSGCLLIGKTASSVVALNHYFQAKKIDKAYYAITLGKQTPNGCIAFPIETKEATTRYEIEATVLSKKYEVLNLVKLIPITGRKHQLRKHMKQIGNPIMGDQLYGTEGNIVKGNGLYLHAFSIAFMHPFTNQDISVESTLPKKITRIFKVF